MPCCMGNGMEAKNSNAGEWNFRSGARISLASPRAVVAPHDSAHFLEVNASGKGGPGGTVMNAKKPFILRGLHDELSIPLHHVSGTLEWPQHRTGKNHLHRVAPKEE